VLQSVNQEGYPLQARAGAGVYRTGAAFGPRLYQPLVLKERQDRANGGARDQQVRGQVSLAGQAMADPLFGKTA